MLFIAVDGNFRLFRYKNASKVSFPPRFKFFLNQEPLVSSLNQENPPVSCGARFKAADLLYSRNRVSCMAERGVFLAVCARHEIPLVGIDMDSGEKFCYADTLLKHISDREPAGRTINVYYDVACRYAVNFKVRILLFF